MGGEQHLSLVLLVVFLLYGFSNIYIIVFLRRHDGYILGLREFFALYVGNVRNYKKLNDLFVSSFLRDDTHVIFNRGVSAVHLAAPLLIPVSIVVFVAATWPSVDR